MHPTVAQSHAVLALQSSRVTSVPKSRIGLVLSPRSNTGLVLSLELESRVVMILLK